MANHYYIERLKKPTGPDDQPVEWESIVYTDKDGYPVGIYNEMEARNKALKEREQENATYRILGPKGITIFKELEQEHKE